MLGAKTFVFGHVFSGLKATAPSLIALWRDLLLWCVRFAECEAVRLSHLCEGFALLCCGVGVELDVEVEAVGVAAKLEGLGEELAGADGCHEWRQLLGLRSGDCKGLGVLRQRVEAEGGLGNDGQGTEAASDEFAEIVTCDVFDDLASRAGDGAVGKDEGHADDEVAEAAVAVAEGPGVVGGEDAADSGAFGPEGIERYELAVPFEGFLKMLPGATGLNSAGKALPGVFDDMVEAGQVELDVCFGGIAPGLLCASTDWSDGERVFVGVAEGLRDLLGLGWRDGDDVFLLAHVVEADDGG